MDLDEIIITPGTNMTFKGMYQNKYPVEITVKFLNLGDNFNGVVKNIITKKPIKVVKPEVKPSKKIEVLKKIKPEELEHEINMMNQELNTTIRDLDFLLKIALEKNNTECVIKLIKYGADVNYIIGGKNSIIETLKDSNYELAEILIDNGFKFDSEKSLNNFMKILSIKSDLKFGEFIYPVIKPSIIRSTLTEDYIRFFENKTPEFIKFLFKCYNITDCNYDNLFVLSCKYNYLNVIKFLFKKFGKPKNKCFCHRTYLEDVYGCETHLSIACKYSENFEIVKYLLEEEGMKIYFPHNENSSLLERCSSHKNKDIISIIVDHGVDINFKNVAKDMLLTAAEKDDLDFVKFLISKGVKTDEHIVRFSCMNKRIYKFFIEECNFDIDAIFNSYLQETALIIFSRSHKIELVKYLLNRGANIHIKDNHDRVFSDYLTEEERFQLGPFIYPGAKIKGVKKVEL